MKILYNPHIDLRFSDYGIEIPIVDDRASNVFHHLKNDYKDLEFFPLENIPNISIKDVLLAHTDEYASELWQSEKSLERVLLSAYELIDEEGNYNRYNPSKSSHKLSEAFAIVLKQTGLTYHAMEMALKYSHAYFLGGGMHHAMSNQGRGFCVINDIIIGIRKLQAEQKIKTAWVIDVDAHKGDGTAEIAKRDNSIITFSIHMQEGWPLNSGSVRDPWFIPSSIDVGIAALDEANYLTCLTNGLNELKDNYPLPDLAVVVNGADPYEFDELESAKLLKLTKTEMLQRDQIVFQFLQDLNIPQAYLMAGGYGTRSWEIYYQFLKFVGQCSS